MIPSIANPAVLAANDYTLRVYVKHTVVAQGGEDALAAIAALSAQYSKIGSNLNQLARHFNSGGKDTEQLRARGARKFKFFAFLWGRSSGSGISARYIFDP